MAKLPEWVKTSEDYQRWKSGEKSESENLPEEVPRSRKPFLLIVLSILVLLAGGTFLFMKGTPRYSLYQFRQAILNRDGETALKYLDIDSIVDNMMKEVLAKEEPAPRTEWEAAGRNLGKVMVMAMAPAMKETLKSTMKTSLTSADKSNLDNLKKGSIWDLDIKTDGNTAIVTPKGDPSVNFRMAKTGEGYWKIVEFMRRKAE